MPDKTLFAAAVIPYRILWGEALPCQKYPLREYGDVAIGCAISVPLVGTPYTFYPPNIPAPVFLILYWCHTHCLVYLLSSSYTAVPIIPWSLLFSLFSRLSSASLLILP